MHQPLRPTVPGPRAQRGWLLPLMTIAVVAAVVLILKTEALGAVTHWIVEVQRSLHRDLTTAVRAVRDAGLAAAWPLVALSFVYGVFHAAGPGHGKVVVATYVGTQESRLGAAVALTCAASLAQAVTAIVAVKVSVAVLGLGLREARGGVMDLELISFALVMLLGLGLAGRAALALRHATPDQECAACGGHHHVPATPPPGLWGALGVVVAIGMRPCAGALVVLLIAHAGGIAWIGAGAAIAMAVGTAITTSALATLAVFARRTALRVAATLPASGAVERWLHVAALIGGLVLMTLGALLLQAAWTTPAHPFR